MFPNKIRRNRKKQINNFLDRHIETTKISQMVAIPGHFTIVLFIHTLLADSGCASIPTAAAKTIVES